MEQLKRANAYGRWDRISHRALWRFKSWNLFKVQNLTISPQRRYRKRLRRFVLR